MVDLVNERPSLKYQPVIFGAGEEPYVAEFKGVEFLREPGMQSTLCIG